MKTGGAVIMVAAMLFVPLARADVSALIHVASWHFNEKGFNQKNLGLGFRYTPGEWQYSIGGYRNSIYKDSFYASVGHKVWGKKKLSFRAHVGAVSGYSDGLAPLAVPEFVIDLGEAKLVFLYLPKVKKIEIAQVLGLTIEVPFH